MAQLARDEAGHVWDVSDPANPKLVQSAQSPNVVMPAAPKPKDLRPVPGHPNLVFDPESGSVIPLPGVPAEAPKPEPLPGKPGFVLTGDPSHPQAVPIAGLPPAQDDAAAKKQNALEATRNLVQGIERARGLVDNWSTGWGGRAFHNLPDTEAGKLDTIINQEIRGNIFKNWVDTLKAQTDQGTTGIGRIMQSEIPLVTGSLGALDPIKMGRKGTLESLDQIQQRVLRSAAMLNGENPDDPKIVQKYRQQFIAVPGANDTPPSVGPQAPPIGPGAMPPGGPGSPPPSGPGGIPHADYSGMTGGPQQGVATGQYRNVYDPVGAAALSAFIKKGAPYETAAAYAQSHGFNPPNERDYHDAVAFAADPRHHGATNVRADRSVPTTFGERLSASPAATFVAGAGSGLTAGLGDVVARTASDVINGPGQYDANRAAMAALNPGSDIAGNIVGGAGGMFAGGRMLSGLLRAGAKGGAARNLLAFGLKNPIKAGIAGDTAYGATYGASENPDNPLAGATAGALTAPIASLGGQVAAKGLGAVTRGVVDPAVQRLKDAGIPLTVGEALGGGWKKAQDAMTSVFGPGNMVTRRYMDGRRALNEVGYNTAGAEIGTPINAVGQKAVNKLDAAKSQAYNNALDPVSLNLNTPDFIHPIQSVMDAAQQIPAGELPEGYAAKTIRHYVGNNVDQSGVMSGPGFQNAYRGMARTANKASDKIEGHDIGQSLGQAKGILATTLQDQNPGAYEGFLKANRANRMLNILADAQNIAKNQIHDGEVLWTPAQLGQAATNNAKKYNGNIAAAAGNRPFNQLINDSQQVMSSKLPESGTFPRQLMGAALTGGIAAPGGMFGAQQNGVEGAAEGAAIPLGLLTLLGTRRGQQLLTASLLNRPQAARAIGNYMVTNPRLGGDLATTGALQFFPQP